MSLRGAQERRVESLCVRFRQEWAADGAPQIEPYLKEVDDDTRSLLARRLIELEVGLMEQAGRSPTEDSYRRRLPEYAEQIDAVFQGGRHLRGDTAHFSVDRQPTIEYQIVTQLEAQPASLLYRAVRNDNGDEVDVLVLGSEEDSEAKAIRQRIAVASKLEHPAIARVIDSRGGDDQHEYLLEPIAECSLSRAIEEVPGDARRLFSFGQQIASALVAGHRLGLAHGHLSPSNAHVRRDGRCKLILFARNPLRRVTTSPTSHLSRHRS